MQPAAEIDWSPAQSSQLIYIAKAHIQHSYGRLLQDICGLKASQLLGPEGQTLSADLGEAQRELQFPIGGSG